MYSVAPGQPGVLNHLTDARLHQRVEPDGGFQSFGPIAPVHRRFVQLL